MIKAINPGSGIQVDNGYTSWPTFYNNSASNNNTLVGQVRYNGSSQSMEVYDGTTWLSIPAAFPTITLAPHVQAVIEWAQIKMAEESRMRELAARHPTVADAVAARERADEAVRIAVALCDVK